MTNTQNAQVLHDFLTFNPHIHRQEVWFKVGAAGPAKAANVSEDPNICNTTMCIAGSAQWLMNGTEGLEKFVTVGTGDPLEEVADWLGLDIDRAYNMFYTWDEKASLDMLNAVANDDMDKFDATYKAWAKSRFSLDND